MVIFFYRKISTVGCQSGGRCLTQKEEHSHVVAGFSQMNGKVRSV
jgi:peroxiredoxin